MNKFCSVCKHCDSRVKQFDDDYYCSLCADMYVCLKCDRLYDSCIHCHKKLCDCIGYKMWKIEYDWGGDLIFCIQCFEKKDPLTNLYKYFKNKYNETLSLQEIEKVMYKT